MEDFKKEQLEINRNVADHLAVANKEMGIVQTDIAWMKDILKDHGNKLWMIIAGIILTIITQIALKIL